MYSNFVFLDRFLFELSCKNTHTHKHTHTHRDSNEYPIVAFSKNATITRPEENVKQLLYIIAENLTGDKDAILKDVSKVENYNWPLSYEIQQWRKNLSKDMQALLLAIE